MEIMEIENYSKLRKKIVCENCDFKCYNTHDYKRHLTTLKHQKQAFGNKMEIAETVNYTIPNFTCTCNKIFKTNSGLWKHKKKCKNINIDNVQQPISNETIMSVLQQNQELQQMLVEQNKTIIEMTKNNQIITNNNINHINSHNKTFNLQVFLNETCKDAMNINDFVDSLQIQLSDLENVGKNGFVAGISNLIIKNLNALDITQRPVHCNDKKRETIYIKHNNQWYNDTKNDNDINENKSEFLENQKLKKAIKQIAHKNICMISQWKAKYPDCVFSHSRKSDLYNHIIYESMDHSEQNSEKIIKKIVKEVVIDK
jgi:hypothetical protein